MFSNRNRRPPADPVNAMLSYSYALLVRTWTVTLTMVGFDPFRGFYHQIRYGRPSLALDLMESFRPLIADSTVIQVINNNEIPVKGFITQAGGCTMKEKTRKKLITAFERRLSQEITHPIFGYRVSYRRLLELQARLLSRYLLGDIEQYPDFTTR
jgi:CRISPR-associated endonuclease Cas1